MVRPWCFIYINMTGQTQEKCDPDDPTRFQPCPLVIAKSHMTLMPLNIARDIAKNLDEKVVGVLPLYPSLN